MKIFIWSILTILGVLMYLGLYFLVPFTKEYTFLKYLIIALGYISIIIFPFSVYNLIKEVRKKK